MNVTFWLVIVFSGRKKGRVFSGFRSDCRGNYGEISGNNGSLPAIFMTLYGKLVKT